MPASGSNQQPGQAHSETEWTSNAEYLLTDGRYYFPP